MFIVLYRWRVKPNFERQFVESWAEITAYYRENFDSLGSRLHLGDDGIYYGYAQWKSSEQREEAFISNADAEVSEAGRNMREAIEESYPEIRLETVSDYLISPDC